MIQAIEREQIERALVDLGVEHDRPFAAVLDQAIGSIRIYWGAMACESTGFCPTIQAAVAEATYLLKGTK